MVTIIIGSNRKDNISKLIGDIYINILTELFNEKVEMVNLEEMPSAILHSDMYTQKNEWLERLKTDILIPTNKYIFILPEYNGTFPGAVKLFVDALSSKDADTVFYGKKAALVGVSAGKFGNWLGLEHFGVVLNYLKISVFHQKVSISNLWDFMKDGISFEDAKTEGYIKKQLEGFLNF